MKILAFLAMICFAVSAGGELYYHGHSNMPEIIKSISVIGTLISACITGYVLTKD